MNCEGCKYLEEYSQRHPYGSTYATEYLSECHYGEDPDSEEITEEDEIAMESGERCRFYKENDTECSDLGSCHRNSCYGCYRSYDKGRKTRQ